MFFEAISTLSAFTIWLSPLFCFLFSAFWGGKCPNVGTIERVNAVGCHAIRIVERNLQLQYLLSLKRNISTDDGRTDALKYTTLIQRGIFPQFLRLRTSVGLPSRLLSLLAVGIASADVTATSLLKGAVVLNTVANFSFRDNARLVFVAENSAPRIGNGVLHAFSCLGAVNTFYGNRTGGRESKAVQRCEAGTNKKSESIAMTRPKVGGCDL